MDAPEPVHFTLDDLVEVELDTAADETTRLYLNGLLPEGMRIETRPQDWAEPARQVLRERGAWRDRA